MFQWLDLHKMQRHGWYTQGALRYLWYTLKCPKPVNCFINGLFCCFILGEAYIFSKNYTTLTKVVDDKLCEIFACFRWHRQPPNSRLLRPDDVTRHDQLVLTIDKANLVAGWVSSFVNKTQPWVDSAMDQFILKRKMLFYLSTNTWLTECHIRISITCDKYLRMLDLQQRERFFVKSQIKIEQTREDKIGTSSFNDASLFLGFSGQFPKGSTIVTYDSKSNFQASTTLEP